MGKRASTKASDLERGGDFGFPKGATVTILEAEYTTWGEAGEKAVTKGRKATDPALKIVGEIEGVDGDPRVLFLGCGKSERLEPSGDGEFLEIAEGSAATALSASSAAGIFINSAFGKKGDKDCEAYKRHGKAMLDEDLQDEGVSRALVGLKFVAGAEITKRNFADDDPTRKQRPDLVVDEIIEPPTGKTSKKGKAKPKDEDEDEEPTPKKKKPAPVEDDDDDEDEDEPAPKKTGKGGGNAEKRAEKFGVEALSNPKYRKGCASSSWYKAVHTVCRDEDDADAIMKFISDEDWSRDDARPWIWDGDDEVYKAS